VRFGIARRRAGSRNKPVGKLLDRGVAGANVRRFNRRLGPRRLRPGRFLARVVARDAAGNFSRPARVRFRIVR
jgi:hypothetical protein